mgnify:CR=1 FL=1
MAHWLRDRHSSPTASLLVRFAITGIVAGGVQIALLALLLALGAQALPGNAFAFFVAAQFTGTEGKFVPVKETVRGFKEILEGKHDELPERAFYMVGGIEEAVEKARKLAE